MEVRPERLAPIQRQVELTMLVCVVVEAVCICQPAGAAAQVVAVAAAQLPGP